MEKMVVLRSIYREACFRSSRFAAGASAANHNRNLGSRSFFSVSSHCASNPPRNLPSVGRSPFAVRLGGMRYFSEQVTRVVLVKDPEIQNKIKDLKDAPPHSVIKDSKGGVTHMFLIEDAETDNASKDLKAASLDELSHSVGQDANEDVTHMPVIKDPEILNVFKDLMAAPWDELPHSVVQGAKKALSKNTDDKAGQEVLKNVFCAAEAVEEFGGVLISMKMELDDSIGLSGEDVKPLSDEFVNALQTVYQRYKTYLDAFGPDETYLRKKVETELGSKMIYLKMRCSGLGSEWGKVTVLGTSGLSGSYVEQRA